jgi:quercetin 2,3-dioxygenase
MAKRPRAIHDRPMSEVTRRKVLEILAATGAAAAATACRDKVPERSAPSAGSASGAEVAAVEPLGAPPWNTRDPFLFCVHHDDRYPAGNDALGPAASLEGRRLGSDFAGKDGWRMYHGQVVPGFPQHPHRGFETVTVVRRGLLDHADSLGAAARYGRGDVQWLTAGSGIQHAEMFPLLDRGAENPVELFQIWLNLPQSDKMAEPHFTMLWSPTIPRIEARDGAGRLTTITVNAGALAGKRAPAPPPKSWASRPESDVAIWTLAMQPGARWTLPAVQSGTDRTLYFFAGADLTAAGRKVAAGQRIELAGAGEVSLENGGAPSEILLLAGRPIGEPVARHGPFVMNTDQEIGQAYADYRRTRFGGWPWDRSDPVHGSEPERFARHADGRTERPA